MSEILPYLPGHDALTWSVVLFAALAGGALRGLTGFGAALLMAPLLSLVLSARETMCLVTLLNALPVGRATLLGAGRAIDRKLMLPMSLAAFVGVPCGIALVGALPARAFGLVIGLAVVASALALMSGLTLVRAHSPRLSLGVGLLSGMLTGFGGVGGPPAILYLFGVEPDTHRARANFIVFFAVLYPVALTAIAVLGLLRSTDLVLGAVLAPLFLAGGMGGTRLYRRIGKRHFRPLVLVLLMLAGLMAAWPRALPQVVPAAPVGAGTGMSRGVGPLLVRHAPVGCGTVPREGLEQARIEDRKQNKISVLSSNCALREVWHRIC